MFLDMVPPQGKYEFFGGIMGCTSVFFLLGGFAANGSLLVWGLVVWDSKGALKSQSL